MRVMYLLSEVIKPFILCRSHPIAIAENYERPGNESWNFAFLPIGRGGRCQRQSHSFYLFFISKAKKTGIQLARNPLLILTVDDKSREYSFGINISLCLKKKQMYVFVLLHALTEKKFCDLMWSWLYLTPSDFAFWCPTTNSIIHQVHIC